MFEAEPPAATALSGFFDFYFAGVDTLLFDIGVCLNDWCIDLEPAASPKTAPPPSAAYDAERALTAAERACCRR